MPKQSSMNRGKSGANNRRNNSQMMVISHPPQLNGIELRHNVVQRYRVTAAADLSISFQNLLDTFLVATTAVAGTDLFQTVRLRRVRVWAMPAIGQTVAVAVEFGGITAGITGDQAIHTDTSMGIQPAHVDARPAGKSLASDFQVSSASSAFRLTCPAGSVVDVEMSLRSAYGIGNAAAQNALVGATAGVQYIRGLDGLAAAGSNFVPEYVLGQI